MSDEAAQWRIRIGGAERHVAEAELRADVGAGRLSGAEWVEPPGQTEWVPLHTLPVFLEALPIATRPKRHPGVGWGIHAAVFGVLVVALGRGTLPPWAMVWAVGVVLHGAWVGFRWLGRRPGWLRRGYWRTLGGFLGHCAIFFALVAYLGRGTVPVWAGLWAFGVLVHGIRAGLAVWRGVTGRTPPTTRRPSADPFLDEVDAAVASVEAVWSDARAVLGTPPDLAGLTEAARLLDARHRTLVSLHQNEDLDSLMAACVAATHKRDLAPDAVSVATYAAEVAAVEDRIAGIRAASAASDRLAARKRTLLHQLAGLRLAAGQVVVSHSGSEPARAAGHLVEKTAELRDALRASAEVEDLLARHLPKSENG